MCWRHKVTFPVRQLLSDLLRPLKKRLSPVAFLGVRMWYGLLHHYNSTILSSILFPFLPPVLCFCFLFSPYFLIFFFVSHFLFFIFLSWFSFSLFSLSSSFVPFLLFSTFLYFPFFYLSFISYILSGFFLWLLPWLLCLLPMLQYLSWKVDNYLNSLLS